MKMTQLISVLALVTFAAGAQAQIVYEVANSTGGQQVAGVGIDLAAITVASMMPADELRTRRVRPSGRARLPRARVKVQRPLKAQRATQSAVRPMPALAPITQPSTTGVTRGRPRFPPAWQPALLRLTVPS